MKTIYVISEGCEGPVKIGICRSLTERLKALQIGNPRPLKIAATFHVNFVRAHVLEREIHQFLAAQKAVGEWFNLAESSAVEQIRKYLQGRNIETIEINNQDADPIMSGERPLIFVGEKPVD